MLTAGSAPILVAVWHILTWDTPYQDLGVGHFISHIRKFRQARRLVCRLIQLGYAVTLMPLRWRCSHASDADLSYEQVRKQNRRSLTGRLGRQGRGTTLALAAVVMALNRKQQRTASTDPNTRRPGGRRDPAGRQ
ncbi:hypothetical protein ACQPXS_45845 [Streptomyces sp. CA-142005]|uniref:hypothetical protein n=1 Tax=Streptomyces sp. CA-142005 TaxID=3240052 RepID=UPI003D90F36E